MPRVCDLWLTAVRNVRRRRRCWGERACPRRIPHVTIIEHGTDLEGLGQPARPPVAHRHYVPEECAPDQTVMTVTEADVDLWNQAEQLVYRVYRNIGFCDESERAWVEEFEPYRHGSAFHVVIDEDRVVGAIRTIVGPIEGLPIGQLPIEGVSDSLTVCEFGSLAVEEDYRGLGVTNAIHRQAVHHSFRQGVPAFALAVEPWFVDVYRDLYGIPIRLISEPVHYMGSETLVGIVFLDQMVNTLIRERPNIFKWFAEGLEPRLWLPATIDLRDDPLPADQLPRL